MLRQNYKIHIIISYSISNSAAIIIKDSNKQQSQMAKNVSTFKLFIPQMWNIK